MGVNIKDNKLDLFITYEKNIYKTTVQKQLKTIAPTLNNGFELSDASYSVSDIHDYIKCTIRKHETVPTNPPIHA